MRIALALALLLVACDDNSAANLVRNTVGQVDKARDTKVQSDLKAVVQAITRASNDTSSHSAECLGDVKALAGRTAPEACGKNLKPCRDANPGDMCWGGPYIHSVTDPWGNAYIINIDEGSGVASVKSAGPDGKEGTPDDIDG